MTTKSRGLGRARPRKKATDKKPVKESVPFILDQSLLEPLNEAALRLRAADLALERLRSMPQPAGTALEIWQRQLELAELEHTAAVLARDEAQGAVDAETLTVTLQAVSSKRYFEILEQHPPTEEQVQAAHDEAEKGGVFQNMTEAQVNQMRIHFNPDTYPRAIVEACDVTPLDPEELDAIFDTNGDWSQEDRQMLFNVALAVCQRASILKR